MRETEDMISRVGIFDGFGVFLIDSIVFGIVSAVSGIDFTAMRSSSLHISISGS